MKLGYKILIGVATVGVTITTITLATQFIRTRLGKGAGSKEATIADKQEEIIFVR